MKLPALSLLALLACSCPEPQTDCVAVGPDGGSARFQVASTVVTLELPAGALDHFECLSGTEVTLPADAPNPGGPAIELSPAGLTFLRPVSLRIPLTDPQARGTMMTADSAAGPWVALPTVNSGGVAIGSVSHFSTFFPRVAPPPNCTPPAQGRDRCIAVEANTTCLMREVDQAAALGARCTDVASARCAGLVGWRIGWTQYSLGWSECWYRDGGLVGTAVLSDTGGTVAGERSAQSCDWDAGC